MRRCAGVGMPSRRTSAGVTSWSPATGIDSITRTGGKWGASDIARFAEGGIGEIRTSGLHRDGRRYFNDAYEHSKVTIHLDIRGGVGSIRVISD